MTVSVRVRFEVFKRDRFTCSYCGRTPPEILLEVDHVIPRAAGGSDDFDNLLTSCRDCNRGKSARLLAEGSAPAVRAEALEELQHRIEQATAYAEAMHTWRQWEDSLVDEVYAEWAHSFGARTVETKKGTHWEWLYAYERWPSEATIRRFVKELPLLTILEAVQATAAWADSELNGRSYERACRYFYAICWRRIRDSAP